MRCLFYIRPQLNWLALFFLSKLCARSLSIFIIYSHAILAANPKPTFSAQIPEAKGSSAFISSARKAERLYFAEAQKALQKNQLGRYHQILPKLTYYPLLPYLEYQELGDRLATLPHRNVEQFFTHYPDSFLAERLRHRWLRTLASQNLWAEYRQFYDPQLNDDELACLNLRARLATGDKTALADVAPLWDIEKAQSKACDPVFSEWQAAKLLTPELLWSRYSKAVNANEPNLANSLIAQMPLAMQTLALQYQAVAKNPRIILQADTFSTRTPEARAIITMGLENIGQADAVLAVDTWRVYVKRGGFNREESDHLYYFLARQLLLQDKSDSAEQLVLAAAHLSQIDLLEPLIREALRQQDWEKAYRWILRLPLDIQQSDRWTYWLARVMEELKIQEIAGKKSHDIYAALANTRSFYGFLSADKLRIDYNFLDKPLPLSNEFIAAVELNPAIQRSRELFLMGDINAANREWAHSIRRLSDNEMVAAGRLADLWGWHRQAIQTMADAQHWDELQVRFPIAYSDDVKKAARDTALSEYFIFAIARQESAFKTDAKSPNGAMGLMQLLPSTAKSTAKKSGLHFTQNDLLLPAKNITLGSHYLDHLLDTFSGNRILAAAAYNAGPTKVKQWLSKDDNSKLPYDVWIETIPYKETRNYVQNILFYSVIYGYRMGTKQSFITPTETLQGL
jgi:soluble lytic murein transglycosylase